MIKLTAIAAQIDAQMVRRFSDGSSGVWSANCLIARDTELTRPLADPAYFARAFIEAGALAWPNGLELAPWTLQNGLPSAGLLVEAKAA